MIPTARSVTEPAPATAPDRADESPARPVGQVKVSVIVPVYNPGRYLEDCIGALLRQTMPHTEFEAIFVDDGSTDESPARLDALAAEHPHVEVIHQENSGWSGKPRNVGLDAARGEFVFFHDNDDWLGDEALERMYAFAKENHSDIVIGRMAGKNRGVPRELFRKTRPTATLDNSPLIDSLTPHKLFRRAFLHEHKLRFPEERRRLEDHVFVVAAYFAAETISVLSDYVCYYHVRRDDESNAGFGRVDPQGYFRNLSEALDIVEQNTSPGPLRDRLYRRWYRNEMIERLRGRRLLDTPRHDRRVMLEEIGRIATERFGPGVAAGLPATQRVVGSLAKARRLDDLLSLAKWEAETGAYARLDDIGWHGGALRIALTAELRANAVPIAFVRRGRRELIEIPVLSRAASMLVSDDDLDCADRLPHSKIDVLARSRDTGAEYFLPVSFASHRRGLDRRGERFSLVLSGEATLDAATAASGSPLPNGIWDIFVRVSSCGWTKDSRLGAVRAATASGYCPPAVVGEPARVVTPYWTDKGNLSLDVGQSTSRLDHELSIPAMPAVDNGTAGLELRLPLPALVARSVPDAALKLVHENSGEAISTTAVLAPATEGGTGRSVLRAELHEELDPGRWSMEVRLIGSPDGKFIRVPATVTAPADGGAPTIDILLRSTGPDLNLGPTGGRLDRAMSVVVRRARRLPRRVRRVLVRRLPAPRQ